MVAKSYNWKDGAALEQHSKRKHKILREYFRRYLLERCKNPNSRKFKLAVVDGFAGGGRYIDGSPGSPIIFIETLLNTVKEINSSRADQNMPLVDVDCFMILNDQDPEAVQNLKNVIKPYRSEAKESETHVNLQIKFEQGEFEKLVDGFCDKLKELRYSNVIYNLDQCGHSKVNISTIERLISSGKSIEIFLTYAIQALITYLSQDDPKAVRDRFQHLGALPLDLNFVDSNLLSKNEWLGAAERLAFDFFGKSAPFVTPFSIHNPNGWRYWLMHFANNHTARKVYNDVLHDNSSQQAHYGRAGLRMLSHNPEHEKGTLYLFDNDARAMALEQLPDDISRFINDSETEMSVLSFYKGIYNQTPAHSDDIKQAIFESPDINIVTKNNNFRRSPNRILLDDLIILNPQRNFKF